MLYINMTIVKLLNEVWLQSQERFAMKKAIQIHIMEISYEDKHIN